jgi:hypothetical protein
MEPFVRYCKFQGPGSSSGYARVQDAASSGPFIQHLPTLDDLRIAEEEEEDETLVWWYESLR